MQLELALADPPEAAQALWEQLSPALREALIQRLALAIAKSATAHVAAQETNHQ